MKAMNKGKKQGGTMDMRLALRVEGPMWNAYAAETGTMKGAVLLGSIAMMLCENPERKQEFKELMIASFGEVMEKMTGGKFTSVTERPAPESERGGRA